MTLPLMQRKWASQNRTVPLGKYGFGIHTDHSLGVAQIQRALDAEGVDACAVEHEMTILVISRETHMVKLARIYPDGRVQFNHDARFIQPALIRALGTALAGKHGDGSLGVTLDPGWLFPNARGEMTEPLDKGIGVEVQAAGLAVDPKDVVDGGEVTVVAAANGVEKYAPVIAPTVGENTGTDAAGNQDIADEFGHLPGTVEGWNGVVVNEAHTPDSTPEASNE